MGCRTSKRQPAQHRDEPPAHARTPQNRRHKLPRRASSSGMLQPRITSHACRWGCGCSRSRWRWNRTRCTCWRRDRGGACAWASGCTPNHSSKSRTIHNASRRRGVRASASVNGCSQNHSSCCRNICISCSCGFPLNGQNYTINALVYTGVTLNGLGEQLVNR